MGPLPEGRLVDDHHGWIGSGRSLPRPQHEPARHADGLIALRFRLRRRQLARRLVGPALGAVATLTVQGVLASGVSPVIGSAASQTVAAARYGDEVSPLDGVDDPQPGQQRGLGPDERALAITRPLALPPVEVGDVVELVALTVGDDGAAVAHRIKPAVRVLALDDEAITVAVAADTAPQVLGYQATGSIEIVATSLSS